MGYYIEFKPEIFIYKISYCKDIRGVPSSKKNQEDPVCALSDRDGSRHHCPPHSPTAQLNETFEVSRKTVLFIFGGM